MRNWSINYPNTTYLMTFLYAAVAIITPNLRISQGKVCEHTIDQIFFIYYASTCRFLTHCDFLFSTWSARCITQNAIIWQLETIYYYSNAIKREIINFTRVHAFYLLEV